MRTYKSNEMFIEASDGTRTDAALHDEFLAGVVPSRVAAEKLALSLGLTKAQFDLLQPK